MDTTDWTARSRMLLGDEAAGVLVRSHVAVFGLGGVGSWCAEALARSGVGELTLVDQDVVSRSNINRQLVATVGSVGLCKADAMAQRILSINPDCIVNPLPLRYEARTREDFFSRRYDCVADAIDLVACKLDLIATAKKRGVPVVSALGTGNKLDAQRLRICDISETAGCPFARVVRKELRRLGIERHTVIYSDEPAQKPECGEEPPPGRRSVPGSLVWVTASAGMLLAQRVVEELITRRPSQL